MFKYIFISFILNFLFCVLKTKIKGTTKLYALVVPTISRLSTGGDEGSRTPVRKPIPRCIYVCSHLY